MNNMLTIEEVKNFLEVDQGQLEKYLKERKLRVYKIGGTYVRFRKEEVLNLRTQILPRKPKGDPRGSFFEKAGDFWRFNNFYILSLLLLLALVLLIAKV